MYRRPSAVRSADRAVGRLVGQDHGAERARHLETLAVLGESGDRGVDQAPCLRSPRRCEQAEFVAAEPVRAPVRTGDERELRSQPRQQRVAGRVAERVVVRLEAVEVVDREHPWLRRARVLQHPLELGHQAPRNRRLPRPFGLQPGHQQRDAFADHGPLGRIERDSSAGHR